MCKKKKTHLKSDACQCALLNHEATHTVRFFPFIYTHHHTAVSSNWVLHGTSLKQLPIMPDNVF